MMHIHILNTDGSVKNTIIATEEFAESQYPNAWRVADVQPEPEVQAPAIPQKVTAFQAKAALMHADLLDKVKAMMSNPATPSIVKLAWDEALHFERQSPTVAAMAAALGLTDAEIDALFVFAAEVQA